VAKGHIERLKTRYRACVYVGKDPITGRKTYLKESFRTEALARAGLERMLAQVEAENAPDQSATVSVLLDRWMDVAGHEVTTAHTVSHYVHRTIIPAIGDMKLRKIQHRVDLLDRFYTHLTRCGALCTSEPRTDHTVSGPHDCAAEGCGPHVCRGMAPATVRQIHAILSAAFGYAVSWGWMDKNPAQHAHPPKIRRRRARPPQAEQVAQLLNLAWDTSVELAMFLWLAVVTGARRGELAALRWNSVDLRAATLRVEVNYVVRGGRRRLKGTKTDEDRPLSLDTLTVRMLTDFRAQRAAALAPARLTLDEDTYLFSPDPACQRPWHPDHFSHAYRALADTVGIEEPLKNLRHFNATQLLAAGVDLATTAGRLGHSDGGATTLKFYADWIPATDRAAAEQLASGLDQLRSQARQPATARPQLPRTAAPTTDVFDSKPTGPVTYTVIETALIDAIVAGRLQSNDQIPRLTDIAAWFGVSRSTAQRATTSLGAQGYLHRSGHRWRVAAPLPLSGSERSHQTG